MEQPLLKGFTRDDKGLIDIGAGLIQTWNSNLLAFFYKEKRNLFCHKKLVY